LHIRFVKIRLLFRKHGITTIQLGV